MRRLSLISLVVLALACDRVKLMKVLPPNVRVDAYNQESASKIDVLWVVDNSGSMASRQENLAKNFQAFMDVFTKSGVDYRIAVTTTDIFKEKGAFVGNPKIISPTTSNPAAAFANNVRVGVMGSPYEVGLEAAQLALDKQNATNVPKLMMRESCRTACNTKPDAITCQSNCDKATPIDFLRPEAYLYLVFVTDEEDGSAQDVRYFWRSFETAKGIGNDGTVTTAAIMGETGNSCGATPGVRYKALSDLTGGEVGSICDTNFGATLKKLANNAVGLKRKFALADKPDPTTILVTVRYPCTVLDAELTAGCSIVNRTACEGQPTESYNVECTPKQGPGADGWVWEEANNVIFFAGESVPGVKAQIEIQYCPEGQDCGQEMD